MAECITLDFDGACCNISAPQNGEFEVRLEIVDSDDTAIDLTGSTYTATAEYGTATPPVFAVDVANLSTGIVVFSTSLNGTDAGPWKWEAWQQTGSDDRRLLYGTLEVRDTIT